jgi:hypothetical protein
VVQDGDLRARNRSEHGCAGVGGGRRCAGRRSMWHSGPFPAISPASRRNAHAHMHAPRKCLVPDSSHSRSSLLWKLKTHHGRVVLGGHIARSNLLRGGLLDTQAGLRVGRSHGAEDRSTSACVAPNTTDRALSDTTALVAAQQRLQHPTSVPASTKPGIMRGECTVTHQKAASIWVIIARAETGDGHLPAAHVSGHAEAHLPPKQVRAQ